MSTESIEQTSTLSLALHTPVSTEEFRAARPDIAGPDDGPEDPCPLALRGFVTDGFGRGGKDLGCPTGELNFTQDFSSGMMQTDDRIYAPPDLSNALCDTQRIFLTRR